MTDVTPDQILRLDDVLRATGLSEPTIYRFMDAGTFPRPIPLGERAKGWLSREVAAWQRARVAQRDLAGAA